MFTLNSIIKWIAVSLACIGIFIFIFYLYKEYEHKQRKKLEDKVIIKAFHPKDEPCSKDYPYTYTILNQSGKTIEKVNFTVSIKRLGFSSSINRYTSIEEDKIITNNDGYARCFRAEDANKYGKDLTEKDVEIEVTFKNITFKE